MEAVAETIMNLEREWMQAWINKDMEKCNEILSDDFMLSSARGNLVTKEQWLGAAGSLIVGEKFTWHEVKIRIYGNAAVVNAKTSQKARIGENDWSGKFLLTDVWILQNDKWQVVARHGTGPLA